MQIAKINDGAKADLVLYNAVQRQNQPGQPNRFAVLKATDGNSYLVSARRCQDVLANELTASNNKLVTITPKDGAAKVVGTIDRAMNAANTYGTRAMTLACKVAMFGSLSMLAAVGIGALVPGLPHGDGAAAMPIVAGMFGALGGAFSARPRYDAAAAVVSTATSAPHAADITNVEYNG